MKSIAITTFLLFSMVSDPFFALRRNACASTDFNAPEAKKESASGPDSQPAHAAVFTDTKCNAELLKYAKGVFLARLGFAEKAIPAGFLTQVQRACFVTFFSGKRVIACFGGFYPRAPDIAGEIDGNIRMALLTDPRAHSIDRKIALGADVQITFPGEPEPVSSYAEVDPLTEGMLVENERNGVAIVPGEAKTSSWAFREAMKRLGERNAASVRVFKFRALAVSSKNRL
jgi:hypothetical protein